ncbi:MAG: SufB/SufD family protein [Candidatus Odinarchaeia archaeon]
MNLNDLKEKALKAKDKKPQIGDDVSLENFSTQDTYETLSDIGELKSDEKQLLKDVGLNLEKSPGAYVQVDQSKVFYTSRYENVEVLPTAEAIEKYKWLKEYWWKAVPVDLDKFTANVELEPFNGYFIRSKPNTKTTTPVQSCLMLKTFRSKQNIHNVIIAEENSEIHVITGCAAPTKLETALHLGITEFYVKKNAKLTFTMIHKWSSGTVVKPRAVAILEEGAVFINNYIILSPVKEIQTFPTVYLKGEGAKAELYSVIYGSGASKYDVGGRIVVEAKNTRGKVVSRAVATDETKIYARGHLVGKSPDTRAHLECNGLLLSDKAEIHAVPQLSALVSGTELSHEATVGKIEAEQLIYLMSRGLTEEQANDLIVRGFMTVRIPELPDALEKSIDQAIKLTKFKAL